MQRFVVVADGCDDGDAISNNDFIDSPMHWPIIKDMDEEAIHGRIQIRRLSKRNWQSNCTADSSKFDGNERIERHTSSGRLRSIRC